MWVRSVAPAWQIEDKKILSAKVSGQSDVGHLLRLPRRSINMSARLNAQIAMGYYKMVLEKLLNNIWLKQPEYLRQCSATYGCSCARVTWAPQHWSDEASTVQSRPHTVCFLVVSIIETGTVRLVLGNRYPGDPGNPGDLWTHFKRRVWKQHFKKWIERIGACLVASRWYLEEEK